MVEIYEKSSHNGGFQYDLLMILDSGLIFGRHCIYTQRYHIGLHWGDSDAILSAMLDVGVCVVDRMMSR